MKTFKALFVNVLLLIALTSVAQTNVSGTYSTNTNWSLSGSPYTVVGDILVPSGVTFSIDPGVTVNFSGDYQILIKGTAIANGTTLSPITFTGTVAGKAMLLFRSTNLSNSQLSYLKFTGPKYAFQLEDESESSQSTIKATGVLTASNVELNNTAVQTKGYATTASMVINNATVSSSLIKGVYPFSEKITINNSTISGSTVNSDSYNAGIILKNSVVTSTHFPIGCCGANMEIVSSNISSSFFENGSGSPVTGPLKITGSLLTNTNVVLPAARVEMTGTTLSYPANYGLYFGNGSINSSTISGSGATGQGIIITGYNGYSIGNDVVIKNSNINQNNIGITINGANTVTVDSCHFSNTTYNIQNLSTKNITAKNNWWGTADSTGTAAKIYDYYDNATYGIVDCSNSLISGTYSITLQQGTDGIVKENNVTLANGSILSVVGGLTKTFTITPNAGYDIATVTYNGVDVKSQLVNNQFTTPAVTANATLNITFIKVQYRLSVKIGNNIALSLLCDYGATPSFDLSAPADMKIGTVLFNGTSVINLVTGGIYTVPPITANSSLLVTYLSTTDLQGTTVSDLKVAGGHSEILINGVPKGEVINVYTVVGSLVKSIISEGSRITLPVERNAVYIVKTGTKSFKVII
jgi:hypothetical protein